MSSCCQSCPLQGHFPWRRKPPLLPHCPRQRHSCTRWGRDLLGPIPAQRACVEHLLCTWPCACPQGYRDAHGAGAQVGETSSCRGVFWLLG